MSHATAGSASVACRGDARCVAFDLASLVAHDRPRVVLTRVVGQVQYAPVRSDVARDAGGSAVSVAGEMVLPAVLALRGTLPRSPDAPVLARDHLPPYGKSRATQTSWVRPGQPRVTFW